MGGDSSRSQWNPGRTAMISIRFGALPHPEPTGSYQLWTAVQNFPHDYWHRMLGENRGNTNYHCGTTGFMVEGIKRGEGCWSAGDWL